MIKDVGARLVAANPKGGSWSHSPGPRLTDTRLAELAVGNIVRKVLRLIREEYKVACANHLAHLDLNDSEGTDSDVESDVSEAIPADADHSEPGTPMPPTPGIHVPANHYLSREFQHAATQRTSSPSTSTGKQSFFPAFGAISTDAASPSQSPRPVPRTNPAASLSTFVQMRHNKIQLERAGSTTSVFTMGAHGGGGGGGSSGFDMAAMTPGIFASDVTSFFTPGITGTPERQTSFPGLTPQTASAAGGNGRESPKPLRRELKRAQHQAVKQQEQFEAFNKKSMQMKPVLVDAIREVVDEIETTWESCAKGAREHVHSS